MMAALLRKGTIIVHYSSVMQGQIRKVSSGHNVVGRKKISFIKIIKPTSAVSVMPTFDLLYTSIL